MKKSIHIKNKVKDIITQFILDSKELNSIGIKKYLINQRLMLLFILVFFLCLGIFIGNDLGSKDRVFKNLEIALKYDKPYKINSYIRFNGEKLSSNKLKPMTLYYSNNRSSVDFILDEIKSSGKSGVFSLKSESRFFTERYYIDLEPVSLKVESNFDPSAILLNNNSIKIKGISKGIIPGLYTLSATLNTSYGELEITQELALLEDKTVNLNFEAVKLTISSNYDDAKVFIDNLDTNLTASDIKDYGPIPVNKNIDIYLKKKFPWGEVESERFKITNTPLINIYIDGITDDLKKDLESTINEFYFSSFDALNNEDYSLFKNCKEEVKEKIYDELNSKVYFLKNTYEISELITEIQKGELQQNNGIYTSQVVTKVKYKVDKKILPFLKSNKEAYFMVDLTYKEGVWIIDNIENIKY